MADEMSDCPPNPASGLVDTGQAPSAAGSAVNQLPTLQRNALRKLFDRYEFTAEEVALLSYRRLQLADGIGNKGLAAIADWLQAHGFELKPPEVASQSKPELPRRMRRNIESAVRLLQTHGYVVQQGGAPRPERQVGG